MKTNLTLAAAALVILLATVLGFMAFRPPPFPTPPPLPVPNGYDDFLAAARLHIPIPKKPDSLTKSELEEALKPQTDSLRLLHSGLAKKSQVTLGNSQAYMLAHVEELGQLSATAKLLAAEARLFELQNSLPSAASSYLDLIRYGQEMSRGGLLIDRLVGISAEKLGIAGLFALHQKLTAPDCLALIKRLDVIEADAEPFPVTLERERAWAHASFDWQNRLLDIVKPNLLAGPQAKFVQSSQNAELARRRLAIDLAARAYEADHQKRPTAYPDLVPQYLPRIPTNSSTGAPITHAWH